MPSSASSTSSHPLPSATLAQVFASDDEDTLQLKYIEQMPFLEFLNVPHDRLPKDDGQVTLDTVVQVANSIAKFMKDLCEYLLLYFAPLSTFDPSCRFSQ